MDSVEEKENYKKTQPGFCKFFIVLGKDSNSCGDIFKLANSCSKNIGGYEL